MIEHTYFHSDDPLVIDAYLRGIWEGIGLDKRRTTNK